MSATAATSVASSALSGVAAAVIADPTAIAADAAAIASGYDGDDEDRDSSVDKPANPHAGETANRRTRNDGSDRCCRYHTCGTENHILQDRKRRRRPPPLNRTIRRPRRARPIQPQRPRSRPLPPGRRPQAIAAVGAAKTDTSANPSLTSVVAGTVA